MDDKVPALGHDWGEWEVVTEPTYEAEGLEQRVCKNDASHIETRAIAKLEYETLTLKESKNNTEGEKINVTVTYSRKGNVAFSLTPNIKDSIVTYSTDKEKVMTVNENGDVIFLKMCVRCKDVNITATTADGKTAECHVTIQYKWWQYILWVLFGSLWF